MDKFNINEALGEILKKYRLKRERPMSQIEFSELLGVDFTYYGRIERGEHSITIDTCLRISTALGIRLEDLFKELPV